MGLRERRLAEELKTKDVAEAQTTIKKTSGSDIVLDINWDTFIAYDEYPLTRLQGSVLPEIVSAIGGLCVDQMGKDALAARVKKITITNLNPDEDFSKAITKLNDSSLDIVVSLAGGTYSCPDGYSIQKYLEDNL
jgi:hypothetical protein